MRTITLGAILRYNKKWTIHGPVLAVYGHDPPRIQTVTGFDCSVPEVEALGLRPRSTGIQGNARPAKQEQAVDVAAGENGGTAYSGCCFNPTGR